MEIDISDLTKEEIDVLLKAMPIISKKCYKLAPKDLKVSINTTKNEGE